MTTLHIYLPQDRRRALARGESLPDRTWLGEEAFNAAWAEGQAMTLEDAIALALTP